MLFKYRHFGISIKISSTNFLVLTTDLMKWFRIESVILKKSKSNRPIYFSANKPKRRDQEERN